MGKKTEKKPKLEPEVEKKVVALQPPQRKVTLIRDHVLEYPQLYCEVFVVEPGASSAFAEMFARAACKKAESLDKADLVIFSGGHDVSPSLYGAKHHPETKTDPERDMRDMEAFRQCVSMGIPMVGFCRGAQFLHVMNGGKLYQHVDGHIGEHSMVDFTNNRHIGRVSSTHHQLCIRNDRMQVLATAGKSRKRYFDNDKTFEEGINMDIEAFFYRNTCSLGIQGHPEFRGYPMFTKWSLEQIYELIVCSPDVYTEGGNVRLKKDLELPSESGKVH